MVGLNSDQEIQNPKIYSSLSYLLSIPDRHSDYRLQTKDYQKLPINVGYHEIEGSHDGYKVPDFVSFCHMIKGRQV